MYIKKQNKEFFFIKTTKTLKHKPKTKRVKYEMNQQNTTINFYCLRPSCINCYNEQTNKKLVKYI